MAGRMHCRRSVEIIRKCKLVLLLRSMRLKCSWITVEKSSSHHLSQSEIGSDKPCSQHLSGNSLVSDYRGSLNGSTQHRPEVQSRGVSTAKLFESADSRKTLPCLGLIEYSPKNQVSLKTQSDQQIRRVLHRPVEPAALIRT